MAAPRESKTPFRRFLFIVAAPIEADAVVAGLEGPGNRPGRSPRLWQPQALAGVDLVISGIGKANAAGAAARFADPAAHDAVMSVGIAGALPAAGPSLGEVVLASSSVFADEGIETPGGFEDSAAMGFPLGDFDGPAVPVSPLILDWLTRVIAPESPTTGRVATVSTCSGTDTLARRVRDRTGAIAEGMEGAAVGLVAHRLGIPFAELRVISNTTGDRHHQVWDIKLALSRLSRVIGLMAQTLRCGGTGA